MMKLRRLLTTALIGFAAVAQFVFAVPAQAETPIVLDSKFDDWNGQMYITDPQGDSHSKHGDFLAFYWANNDDDDFCYWMLQRVPSEKNVSYIVYFDANNNGNFSEKVDRAIVVKYRPKKNNGMVTIEVRQADNWQLISRENNQDWGESLNEGAARVEFRASFKDLGFGIGQTIRMYAASFAPNNNSEFESLEESEELVDLEDNKRLPHPDDRIPDSGDVQWSPVGILGVPLLVAASVGGVFAIWFFKGRKTWASR